MSVLGRMGSAKSVEERNPFIGDGRHKVAVERYFVFDSKQHGRSIGVELFVIESERPATPQEIAAGAPAMVPGFAPGTTLFKAWNINRGPKYPGDKCEDEQNEALTFLARLVGGTDDDARKVAHATLDDAPDGPNQQRNALRGMVIVVEGRTQIRTKKDGTQSKPYMQLTWQHHVDAEDPAKIGSMRASLDQVKPIQARNAPAPAAAPQAYAAAPQAAYQYPTAAPAAAPQPAPAPAGYGYAPAPQAAPGPVAYPPQPAQGYGYPAPQPAPTAAPAFPPGALPPGFPVPGR